MKKRFLKGAACAAMMVLSVGVFGCDSNEKTAEKPPTVQETKEVAPPPAPVVKSDDDIVADAVKGTLDYHSNSLCKYKTSKANTSAETVIVELSAEAGWDYKSTVEAYNDTAKYIFASIYQSQLSYPIENVNISFYTTLTNSKTGAESEERIYSIGLTGEAAKNLHWDKIDKVDITLSANGVYIHPSLKNM